MSSNVDFDFGPCCCCERGSDQSVLVRNIVHLSKQAPVPGTGWGCVQCGLGLDGAVAVLCDECLDAQAELRFACRGDVSAKERIPIDELTGEHKHDESQHPELRQSCRVCGCTELRACFDAKHGACWWHEPDLCSHCAMKAGIRVTQPGRPLTAG